MSKARPPLHPTGSQLGKTALNWAAHKGHIAVIDALLAKYANIES
jgi:ankyrin repeat protein